MSSKVVRVSTFILMMFLLLAWIGWFSLRVSAEICDPIIDRSPARRHEFCFFPFPNDFYLVPSDRSFTGYRVSVPQQAFPSPRFPFRANFDAREWNRFDGWSAASFIALSAFSEEIQVRYAGLTQKSHVYEHQQPAASNQSSQGMSSSDHVLSLDGLPNSGLANDESGFASHMNIYSSVQPTSPTVLIDAETGEWVPHWVEMDYASDKNLKHFTPEDFERVFDGVDKDVREAFRVPDDEPWQEPQGSKVNQQTLMVWPSRRLKNGHRYVVAFRNLKSRQTGEVLDAPAGFKAIRDGTATGNAHLEKRRQHFRDRRVFEILEQAGVKRSDLYIAWDFTTASLASGTEHLRYMREEGYEFLHNSNYQYTITQVEEDFSPLIYRRVHGSFKVPLYLRTPKPSTKSRLVRPSPEEATDYLDELRPRVQGWTDVDFMIIIPRSAIDNSNATLMFYGHGLFGTRSEIMDGYLHPIMNRQNLILGATDWMGLQKIDLITIGRIVTWEWRSFGAISDRAAQGILNAVLFARLMRRSNMWNDERVFKINGQSILWRDHTEAKPVMFYGNSLGGIMGSVFVAMSQDVKTAVFGVPGSPFSMVLKRNDVGNFALEKTVRFFFPRPSDRVVLMHFMNQLFILAGPAGYTDILESHGTLIGPGKLSNEMPNGMGPRKILIQVAVGDAQVNTIGGRHFMRSVGSATFPGDAYEPEYALSGKSTFVRDPDNSPRVPEDIHPVILIPLIQSGHGSGVYHTVSTSFHYTLSSVLPFHCISPGVLKLLEDTHSLPRLTHQGQVQMHDFLEHDLELRRQSHNGEPVGNGSEETWVKPACKGGCWNLSYPDSKKRPTPPAPKLVIQGV